jgi:hypothetical protein
MTVFYWLRFETPPNWRARSPFLCPPRTGWPSYTPRHWVPFSSPPTTRKATVGVFNPAFTRTAQKTSLRLFGVLSSGKRVRRAVSWQRLLYRCLFTQLLLGSGCICQYFLRLPELMLAVCCIQLNDEWCRANRKRKWWGRRLSEGLDGSCN